MILASQFATGEPYHLVIECTSCGVCAMNGCADNVILTSQFASGVPYLVVSDLVIVQAVV